MGYDLVIATSLFVLFCVAISIGVRLLVRCCQLWRSWRGEGGGYGNGSIFVHDRDGVTVLDDAPHVEATLPERARKEN